MSSPNTQIYNNTIYMSGQFPWAIEYRFSGSQNIALANNLTNKALMARDGATGTQSNNVTNASSGWFKTLAGGDLHLASSITEVIDRGKAMTGLSDDFDGQPRPSGAGIDVGADEYGSAVVPLAPTDVRAD